MENQNQTTRFLDELTQYEDSYNDFSALIKILSTEATNVSNSIKEYSAKLRNMSDLVELSIHIYSFRQNLVESKNWYMHKISTQTTLLRAARKKQIEDYTTKADYLHKDRDRAELINAELNDIISKSEHLENHLEFLKNSISTVDSMIFGIKHRITLEEYRN